MRPATVAVVAVVATGCGFVALLYGQRSRRPLRKAVCVLTGRATGRVVFEEFGPFLIFPGYTRISGVVLALQPGGRTSRRSPLPPAPALDAHRWCMLLCVPAHAGGAAAPRAPFLPSRQALSLPSRLRPPCPLPFCKQATTACTCTSTETQPTAACPLAPTSTRQTAPTERPGTSSATSATSATFSPARVRPRRFPAERRSVP